MRKLSPGHLVQAHSILRPTPERLLHYVELMQRILLVITEKGVGKLFQTTSIKLGKQANYREFVVPLPV